ncbi:general transcription factor 3C polypeptide 2 isoform X2 [Lampetra planeri]
MEACDKSDCSTNQEQQHSSEMVEGFSAVPHLDENRNAELDSGHQLNVKYSNAGNDDALQTLITESPANNFTSHSQKESEHLEEREMVEPMLCSSLSTNKQLGCSESRKIVTDSCDPGSLASKGQSSPGTLTTQSGGTGDIYDGLAPTRGLHQDRHSEEDYSRPMENVIRDQSKSSLHNSSEAAVHLVHLETTILENVHQPCLPKDQFVGESKGRPRGRGFRGGRRGRGRGRGTQSLCKRDTDTHPNVLLEFAVQFVEKQDEGRAVVDVAESVDVKQPKYKKKSATKAECIPQSASPSAEGGRPKRQAAVMAKKFLQDLLLVEGSQQEASASDVPHYNHDKKKTSDKHTAFLESGEHAESFTDDSRDEDFIPEDGTCGSITELYSDGDSWDEESKDSELRSQSEKQRRATRSLLPCDRMSFFHEALQRTREHRQIHYSSSVYPQWVPLITDWTLLSASDSVKYLPKERRSPRFEIRREAFPEALQIHQLHRFEALPLDSRAWDLNFFVGGPVWSLDWGPTPNGSLSNQHVALYANSSALDLHKLNQIHREPALLQVWNLGPLQSTKRSLFQPALAYGVALDFGCIWDMKFCPSGSWEDPTAPVKVPRMARMGLLAAAFSDGKVRVFSLPHAEDLPQAQLTDAEGSQAAEQKIYKVKPVVTLEVGSVNLQASSTNGACFCLAWSPLQSHSHLAVGFYDGSVGLWDLTTKSSLLRVKKPDGNVILYPYNTFSAHDNLVKSLAWCPMNKNFLVTASHDRWIKFWDVRRAEEPSSAIRRHQNTEVAWLLHSCGVVVAQENCYAAYGVNGIHYLDYGFLGYKPYLFNPRVGTIWSVSGSDWLNAVFSGESTGEVIGAILPNFWKNPHNIKHPYYSRFPVYATQLKDVPCNEEGHREEASPPSSTLNEQNVTVVATDGNLSKYTVVFHDTDLTCFDDTNNREPFQNMNFTSSNHATLEGKLPITGIHKVRINPNLDAHVWILSAGFSGIIRAHNVFAMNTVLTDPPNEACQSTASESTKEI